MVRSRARLRPGQIPVAKPLKSNPQNEQPISLKKSTNGHLRLVRSLELSSSCACGAINILTKYWSHDSLPVLLRLSRFESSGLQILFRWLGRPQKGPRSETTLLPTLAILVSKQIPTTPTHPDFWEGRQKRKLFTANE
jgi:hypothetical protein